MNILNAKYENKNSKTQKQKNGNPPFVMKNNYNDLAGYDQMIPEQIKNEMQESSYISGINRSFFENTRSDSQLDKKPSNSGYPCPQPITIETSSTIDFHESVSRPFAGISQQQI